MQSISLIDTRLLAPPFPSLPFFLLFNMKYSRFFLIRCLFQSISQSLCFVYLLCLSWYFTSRQIIGLISVSWYLTCFHCSRHEFGCSKLIPLCFLITTFAPRLPSLLDSFPYHTLSTNCMPAAMAKLTQRIRSFLSLNFRYSHRPQLPPPALPPQLP